jgi:hypothetical protein
LPQAKVNVRVAGRTVLVYAVGHVARVRVRDRGFIRHTCRGGLLLHCGNDNNARAVLARLIRRTTSIPTASAHSRSAIMST